MATSRQQPPWQPPLDPPANSEIPPVRIYNSLTRRFDAFVPIDSKDRKVTWYACGPTVYDDAHLGHARNYVSTDIIRRVMRDYFKYNVRFVMNITDVDDKIIVRGRQQYLLSEFLSGRLGENPWKDSVLISARKAYITKNLPRVDAETPTDALKELVEQKYADVLKGQAVDGQGVPGDKEAKIKMHIKTLLSASEAMPESSSGHLSYSSEEFQDQIQDVVMPYLDLQFGPTINANDHSIFTRLTQKFEARFMEDVRALNCLDPDEITRVTEYGPQIVDFVKKIQDNDFGYSTSDGSVYFDIEAFEAANNDYARLEPWNRNNEDLLADGEGALSGTVSKSEKRSKADFALWKSSKPGEPSWPSPWGEGRPGWHIECSAMASDKLGSRIDIHSGGIDLAFPHHDNELAQSEAYWLEKGQPHSHQWVNYFMHMGHLSIQGSKMSKSLKNFTTIREALSRGDWTPRGLRIVFLLGNWHDGIEITEELTKEASAWEDKLDNFFMNAKDKLERAHNQSDGQTNERLAKSLQDAKAATYDALCNSFDTKTAMARISSLITDYNSIDKSTIANSTTSDIAAWITTIVNTFGLNGDATPDNPTIGWSGIEIPPHAQPHILLISRTRDELRTRARSSTGITTEEIHSLAHQIPDLEIPEDPPPASAPYQKVLADFKASLAALPPSSSSNLPSAVLALCDRVRDVDLWKTGIYLEDREGEPALMRPVSRELRAVRAEKEELEGQKRGAREERERVARERAERGRVSHSEMFRTGEWSEWDEGGVPMRDREGEVVGRSREKKLRKEWAAQKRLHEAWVRGGGMVEGKEEEGKDV